MFPLTSLDKNIFSRNVKENDLLQLQVNNDMPRAIVQ